MFSGKKKDFFPKYPAVEYECVWNKAVKEISGFGEEVVEEGRLTFFILPLICPIFGLGFFFNTFLTRNNIFLIW